VRRSEGEKVGRMEGEPFDRLRIKERRTR